MDETLFHAYPDRDGFPRYTIDLVSPELPCGAGWLANCLIELGIPAWKPWNADDRGQWVDLGGYRYRHRLDGSAWTRLLPALVDGREFVFRPGEALRVHHVWPTAYPAAQRSILFMRDPRDALYSAWQRQRQLSTIAPDVGFGAFCASRFHHYPVSWASYLLVFLRVCQRAIDDFGGRLVRFEDYRRDPAVTLVAVLEYLGVEADADAIASAVDRSSFERVRAADAALTAAGTVPHPLLHGGAPGACERELGRIAADAAIAGFGDVLDRLGYRGVVAGTPTHVSCSTATAMIEAIRIAGVPVAEDGWLADAVRAATQDVVSVA
jgi:hypothetical protein